MQKRKNAALYVVFSFAILLAGCASTTDSARSKNAYDANSNLSSNLPDVHVITEEMALDEAQCGKVIEALQNKMAVKENVEKELEEKITAATAEADSGILAILNEKQAEKYHSVDLLEEVNSTDERGEILKKITSKLDPDDQQLAKIEAVVDAMLEKINIAHYGESVKWQMARTDFIKQMKSTLSSEQWGLYEKENVKLMTTVFEGPASDE